MTDDLDFDFDDPDMDLDDVDMDDESYRPRTNFGSDFKQQFKLEKMRLRYADKANRRMNSVRKVSAKKQSKIALTISFAALIFKLMLDHHIDKLTAEQQRDVLKEAKASGVPEHTAKKLASMSKSQLANTIAQANSYILKKAVSYNA